MQLGGESVLDRERICDECKSKPATCIFDRALVCAGCYSKLDAALARESINKKPLGRATSALGRRKAENR
jgi:hypothetical protein